MSGYPGMVKVPWTDRETEIVKAVYPTGGYAAVAAAILAECGIERSVNSMRGAVKREKLRRVGRTYIQQPTNPDIDACIERAYRNGKPDVHALARRLGRTHGWTKWRARELGVAKGLPDTVWTAAEEALLESLAERGYTVSVMYRKFRAAGYKRTLTAIRQRVGRMGLSFERDFWNASDVGKAFGRDGKDVLRWIEKGWLKAKQGRGPSVDDLPPLERKLMWQVKPAHLRDFMLRYPHEWDHRRMQKEVLLDVLCGDRHGLNNGGLGVNDAARLPG